LAIVFGFPQLLLQRRDRIAKTIALSTGQFGAASLLLPIQEIWIRPPTSVWKIGPTEPVLAPGFHLYLSHVRGICRDSSITGDSLRGNGCDVPIWVGVAKAMIRSGLAGRVPAIQTAHGRRAAVPQVLQRPDSGSPNVELRATQALLDEAASRCNDLSVGAPEVDADLNPQAAIGGRVASGYPRSLACRELRARSRRNFNAKHGVRADPQWKS